MLYSSLSYLGFLFPNPIALTSGKGFITTGPKDRGTVTASTFSGLQRPRTFSVHHLIIPTRATAGLITFVRLDFSPLTHLRAGGPRQFFGGSMSDFS